MTRVVFLDPAEEEMLEAAAYYEDRADGLGDHFIAEVQHASIQSNALWRAQNQAS